jgi:hypothetical protein
MRNTCNRLTIVQSWMAYMSAFCVLAAQHRVQAIGGTEISISDQLS